MVKAYKGSFAQHTLLKPVNLCLGNAVMAHPWLSASEFAPDENDDQEAYIYWTSLTPTPVDSEQTWPLLWEVARLSRASSDELIAFARKWGTPGTDWESDGFGDSFGSSDGTFSKAAMACDSWRDLARTIERILVLFASTVEHQLVDMTLLEAVKSWDMLPDKPEWDLLQAHNAKEEAAVMRRLGTTSISDTITAHYQRREELRWDLLLDERRRGEGLEGQRRLLCTKLNNLLGLQFATFSWDDRGRRMEREATGIAEIALSHIAALFVSAESDILICSVCGRAFPFEEREFGRRPRFGVRRFCSDTCRHEGKLESNRESWRRNSARLRTTRRKR
jgi:hypothetical protein